MFAVGPTRRCSDVEQTIIFPTFFFFCSSFLHKLFVDWYFDAVSKTIIGSIFSIFFLFSFSLVRSRNLASSNEWKLMRNMCERFSADIVYIIRILLYERNQMTLIFGTITSVAETSSFLFIFNEAVHWIGRLDGCRHRRQRTAFSHTLDLLRVALHLICIETNGNCLFL